MKYINCEFGIEGRPPYVEGFFMESDAGPEIEDDNFPNQYIVGPGLDYNAWNGCLLIGPKGSLWGVRVNYYEKDSLITENSFEERVTKSTDHAPDGRFAQISTDGITIYWSRKNDNMILGCATVTIETRIVLECYSPYGWPSTFERHNDYITGKSPYVATIKGKTRITGGHAQYSNRYRVIMNEEEGHESFSCLPFDKPVKVIENGDKVSYEYYLDAGESIYFLAAVNDSLNRMPSKEECKTHLNETKEKYLRERLWGTGLLGRCAEPLVNEMMWMRTYFPFDMKPFFPAGRPWMKDGNFNIWGWDETFNGCISSVFSDLDTVKNQFAMTIGDERMGLLMLLFAYTRFNKLDGLMECYEGYKTIYKTNDTKLVKGGWGNGNVGKGMDDTPMRETWRGMGEMYSLDMTCMKAWSIEALSKIAEKLGFYNDSIAYEESYKELVEKINKTFWNEDKDIYMNRYISGEWSITVSPTSFYPLAAGVPDKEKAYRLMKSLKDESQFWGEYVIPTLSKNDVEYGKPSRVPHNGMVLPEFCYWRGTIWPPSSYLVYIGLVRYRFDELAEEFALKSIKMWWETWEKTGWSCENYNPINGERSAMSHKHQSWAQLFPLMGIQQMLDVEVWSSGLRFGSVNSGNNTLQNIKIKDHLYSISIKDRDVILYKDGDIVFKGWGGQFTIHEFNIYDASCTFIVNAFKDISIELTNIGKMDIPKGIHRINVNVTNKKITILGEEE